MEFLYVRYKYDSKMESLSFEWDASKSHANFRKHGVSFEEASTVFYDDNALDFYDLEHSEEEDRFILLGMSFKARVVVVVNCRRVGDSVIRIISARKATMREYRSYGRGVL
jgi:uncharacterized DUF497 family protein